jgi:hypothetical protein
MSTSKKIVKAVATGTAAAALLSASACGDSDNGQGTVTITTWGEEYIEEGLPSDAFPHDHFSVKYTRFLVVFRDVQIADENHQVGAKLEAPLVFDLTKPGAGKDRELASFQLEAKAWPHVSYQQGPITANAQPGELATQDDVRLLQTDQAAVHVEGVATSPTGTQKTFNWSFATATLFQNCHGEQDGKEVDGVLVTNGGTQEVQLTVHGDHLFYDDLQSEEGAPRFQALADADANGDGAVTLEELDQIPLYTIPLEQGTYGTGALGNVNTLGQYQRTLARTIGHYRGEGSCDSKEASE